MYDKNGIEIKIYLTDHEADKVVATTVNFEEYKEMLILHKENILETIIDQLERKLKYE